MTDEIIIPCGNDDKDVISQKHWNELSLTELNEELVRFYIPSANGFYPKKGQCYLRSNLLEYVNQRIQWKSRWVYPRHFDQISMDALLRFSMLQKQQGIRTLTKKELQEQLEPLYTHIVPKKIRRRTPDPKIYIWTGLFYEHDEGHDVFYDPILEAPKRGNVHPYVVNLPLGGWIYHLREMLRDKTKRNYYLVPMGRTLIGTKDHFMGSVYGETSLIYRGPSQFCNNAEEALDHSNVTFVFGHVHYCIPFKDIVNNATEYGWFDIILNNRNFAWQIATLEADSRYDDSKPVMYTLENADNKNNYVPLGRNAYVDKLSAAWAYIRMIRKNPSRLFFLEFRSYSTMRDPSANLHPAVVYSIIRRTFPEKDKKVRSFEKFVEKQKSQTRLPYSDQTHTKHKAVLKPLSIPVQDDQGNDIGNNYEQAYSQDSIDFEQYIQDQNQQEQQEQFRQPYVRSELKEREEKHEPVRDRTPSPYEISFRPPPPISRSQRPNIQIQIPPRSPIRPNISPSRSPVQNISPSHSPVRQNSSPSRSPVRNISPSRSPVRNSPIRQDSEDSESSKDSEDSRDSEDSESSLEERIIRRPTVDELIAMSSSSDDSDDESHQLSESEEEES